MYSHLEIGVSSEGGNNVDDFFLIFPQLYKNLDLECCRLTDDVDDDEFWRRRDILFHIKLNIVLKNLLIRATASWILFISSSFSSARSLSIPNEESNRARNRFNILKDNIYRFIGK